MATDLFPHRTKAAPYPVAARCYRGNDRMIPDGLDADSGFHRQSEVPAPELRVTDDGEVGKLYGPDGRSYRVVREGRPRVPFGFAAEAQG